MAIDNPIPTVWYSKNPDEQYTIEYTDMFGKVYRDPVATYTREMARAIVRDMRTRDIYNMFDTGRRTALKNVRVVKSH